ncbi:MAG: hypothetical protein WA477_06925 [Candidatus Sulfotelmatobacter sp.]
MIKVADVLGNKMEDKITSSPGQPPGGRYLSRKRLMLAFALAAIADGLSITLTFTPWLQWVLDVVTALALFVVLGWQWVLLPGLILEAIPGINVFPFWLLVVGAIALLGKARPNPKVLLHASQEVGKSFIQRVSGRPPRSKDVGVEIASSDEKL